MNTKENADYTIDYNIIMEYYSMDDLLERFGIWYAEAKKFIEKKGLTNYAMINTKRLGYAVCDYFVDIIRMKEFHGIEHANLNKIYAYSSYWFLRRQPIQLVSGIQNDTDLYLNELFIINNLIAKMKRHCTNLDLILKPSLLEMAKLWFYNFKFRVFTAQSLEMAICSFFVANGNRSTAKK